MFKEQYERDRNLFEFIYKQSDSFITWIIGFAVAGLALIASKMDSTDVTFKDIKNTLTILLGASILFGVAFRYFFYSVMVYHKRLENYFAGALADIDVMPIEADEDTDNCSFDELIFRLKVDFDETIPYKYPLSDEEKESEQPALVRYYKNMCAHSRKQFDLAIDRWAVIHSTAYRTSKQRIIDTIYKNIKSPKVGFNLKAWARFVNTLYLLTLVCFTAAVVVVCLKMLA